MKEKTTKTKTKQTKRTGRESEKGHHMEGFQCFYFLLGSFEDSCEFVVILLFIVFYLLQILR